MHDVEGHAWLQDPAVATIEEAQELFAQRGKKLVSTTLEYVSHQVEEEKKQPVQGRRAYRSYKNIGSDGYIDPERIKAQAAEIEKKLAGKARAVP
jgi:hypothetical protein